VDSGDLHFLRNARRILRDAPASLDLLGEDYAAELVVRLRKSIHATRPALQTRLTRGGIKWRVRLVVSNDCDATWTLRCEPDN
jgi:hypothetical protein